MDAIKLEAMQGSFSVDFEGQLFVIEKPITINEFISQTSKKKHAIVVAARIDNHLRELTTIIDRSCQVELIDLNHLDGVKIYQRSCLMIFKAALFKCYPEAVVHVIHSLENGRFMLLDGVEITKNVIQKLTDTMMQLVASNIEIRRRLLSMRECRDVFEHRGDLQKIRLFKYRDSSHIGVYDLDGFVDHLFGYLVPSTGFIKNFDLQPLKNGIVLSVPSIISKQSISQRPHIAGKFFAILNEFDHWLKVLGVESVCDVNTAIENKGIADLIKVTEALHEKKIARIADRIARGHFHKDSSKRIRIVAISGPSSSGKTTFSKRLDVQLRTHGIRPLVMGLDSYYNDLEHVPRDKNGEYDFESIDALDSKLLNHHLSQLIAGEEINLPLYDFQTGCRVSSRESVALEGDQLIVIEGIHGLNPQLTRAIATKNKYFIYVSALTQVRFDHTNLMSTTDLRLLRRTVRDAKFRNYSVEQTLSRWQSVRFGEERHIFPFQENANVMFNSALVYEIPILKLYLEPMLRQVTDDSPVFPEANRLLKLLNYFLTLPGDHVPPTSILREFIGRSTFDYE